MPEPPVFERHDPRVIRLKLALLAAWAIVSFGVCFFARELDFQIGPWRFDYWMAAQGALGAFIAIVAVYAWAMTKLAPEDSAAPMEPEDGR
ncbi:MAG TPA: sodium/substrate symporter small subunit [Ramlibacter sp.]|uniref:DUF4212 domain-containing protein n=1 Tax=Ramlibacter sp. TaxID=1917967 RepID=UPI002B6DD8B4|nr:sodium/substrate symporter small subunit [Ramlibacter sp.]HVZ44398.1 sodium/substrate symporter small subunit [Ramlibacter sp.]